MNRPFVYPPFGSIDIPECGKLPPAPSYRTVRGLEVSCGWCDMTCVSDPEGRRLHVPYLPVDAKLWPSLGRPTDRRGDHKPWNSTHWDNAD